VYFVVKDKISYCFIYSPVVYIIISMQGFPDLHEPVPVLHSPQGRILKEVASGNASLVSIRVGLVYFVSLSL
jgi:hypothetical protein